MNARMRLSLGLAFVILVSAASGGAVYHYRPFSTRLAAYVTDLSARSEAQLRNIQHVQRQLGETILKSGEVFSLNERAGPYTVERGFMEERSYLNRKPATSPGGGVCQFASTLYNAAYRAGLEVLERVPHSQAVFSVPPGQDATIAYGVADLKLQNRYPFPVKIISKIAQDQLRIEIWGKEPPDEFHDL